MSSNKVQEFLKRHPPLFMLDVHPMRHAKKISKEKEKIEKEVSEVFSSNETEHYKDLEAYEDGAISNGQDPNLGLCCRCDGMIINAQELETIWITRKLGFRMRARRPNPVDSASS